MNVLSANEIKTRGVSALQSIEDDGGEAMITVRGREKYVIMTVEQYNHLRECEIEAALMEAKKDIEDGNVIIESVSKHLKRIRNGL